MKFQLPILLPVLAIIYPSAAPAQQTPPIEPKIQRAPLPPVVEIPSPTTLPADVPNRPLTADEAARIALRHQPSVTSARAGIEAAKGRTQQARSGLLPTVGVTAGYTHLEEISSEGGGSSSGGSGGTNFGGVTVS